MVAVTGHVQWVVKFMETTRRNGKKLLMPCRRNDPWPKRFM
jgi:hypothetical protein